MSNISKLMTQAAAGAGGDTGLGTFIQSWSPMVQYSTNASYMVAPYYDADGNIYISANYFSTLTIASYDSDNTLRWAKRYSGTYGSSIYPTTQAMTVDNGTLYVLARNGSQYSLTLEINSSTGAITGNNGLRTSTLDVTGKGAAATSDGYFVEAASGSTSDNIAGINVYSQTGDLTYVKYLTYTNAYKTDAVGPKIDSDDNIYVPWGLDGAAYCFISKYNSSFAHQWTVRFRTGSYASWRDMCVSSDLDAIYGTCYFNDGDHRANIIKWDRDGTKLYTKSVRYFDTGGFDRTSSISIGRIAIGEDGYLYVSGVISRSFTYDGYEGRPAFVLKLDPDDLSLIDHFFAGLASANYQFETVEASSASEPNRISQLMIQNRNTYDKYSFNLNGMPTGLPRTACGVKLFRASDVDPDMDIYLQNQSVSSSIISTATATNGSIGSATTGTMTTYTSSPSAGCNTDLE
jgi:hypothetical protein